MKEQVIADAITGPLEMVDAMLNNYSNDYGPYGNSDGDDRGSNSTDLYYDNALLPYYKYGGDKLKRFAQLYDPVHKPLTLFVCLFGVISNALNIIVLTRKRMISPTNILLTGLSVNQLLLVLSYLSLLLFNFLLEDCTMPTLLASYNWTMYKWANVNFNVAFHTTALGHTMCFTILRFIAVQSPQFSRSKITVIAARRCTLVLCIIIPLMCSPTFFTTYVDRVNATICGLEQYYDLHYVASEQLFQATLWLFGVVLKLLPSLSIASLSLYLIISLKHIDDNSLRLTRKENVHRKMRRQRLTKMLVTVALLCVSVELPHGIVNLLTGIFGAEFGTEVYDNLGDFFEMLTLFYSSVNFVLFCLMSSQFQITFRQLLFDPILKTLCSVYTVVPTSTSAFKSTSTPNRQAVLQANGHSHLNNVRTETHV